MNPTGQEILNGAYLALVTPPSAETEGAFAQGKAGIVGLLCVLAAQEMEWGVKVRAEENAAMRSLFAAAVREAWCPWLETRLAALAAGEDRDLTLSVLDAANAELRRVLINLHAAVEQDAASEARDRERRILALLRAGAQARKLDLPAAPSS